MDKNLPVTLDEIKTMRSILRYDDEIQNTWEHVLAVGYIRYDHGPRSPGVPRFFWQDDVDKNYWLHEQ